jgi:hypothetical protein
MLTPLAQPQPIWEVDKPGLQAILNLQATINDQEDGEDYQVSG